MKTLEGTNLVTFEALHSATNDTLIMQFGDGEEVVIDNDLLSFTAAYPEEDIHLARAVDIELHERSDRPLTVTDSRFLKFS